MERVYVTPVENMSKEFEWSPGNTKYRKSNRAVLAHDRASRIVRICNRILAIIEDPTTDSDTAESILVTYSELEERLERIQERNFYKNTRIIRQKRKKKQTTKELLKYPAQQQQA